MDSLVHAADVSVYSGLIGRPEWAAAKEDHSIELAIVGSWHGSSVNRYAEHVLSGARMAGLMTATYIVLAEAPRGRHGRPEGVRPASPSPLVRRVGL